MTEMTEAAKAARREYKRQWAHNNPDKVRAATRRYWERKATVKATSQESTPSGESAPSGEKTPST